MKDKNEIKYGTILTYIYLIIYNIVQLIYTPILLKSLGNNLYGVYSLCISIVNYFTLLDFGLGNAVVRFTSLYKDKEEREKNSIYGSFFKIYLVLAFIALFIGVFLSVKCNWLFSSDFSSSDVSIARTVILILSINIAITLPLSVFSSIVTAYQKFIFLKVMNILKTIVSTVIMILLLLIGYKAIAMAMITLLFNLLYLICITIYATKKLKIRLVFAPIDKRIYKEIFSFSIFAFLLLIIDKINLNIDMIILGKFSNPKELTMYSITSKIFQIFISFSGVISGMLLPKYTKLVKERKYEELEMDFFEKSKWQYTIIIYLCFGFLIIGKSFLSIWLGGDFSYSYYLTIILMFFSAVPLALNVANVILQAKNQQKFRTFVLLIVLVFNIIISILLVRKYGAIGCTIGTAFTYIVGHVFIMGSYLNKRQAINMSIFWINIIKISIVHLFAFGVSYIVKLLNINLYASDFICVIIYLTVSTLLEYKYLLNFKEKEMIKEFVNKMRRRHSETS